MVMRLVRNGLPLWGIFCGFAFVLETGCPAGAALAAEQPPVSSNVGFYVFVWLRSSPLFLAMLFLMFCLAAEQPPVSSNVGVNFIVWLSSLLFMAFIQISMCRIC
jgi:hypothetical protein